MSSSIRAVDSDIVQVADYRGNAAECAAALGRAIVYPAANQLFLDIDDNESWELFLDRYPILGGLLVCYSDRASPSGRPGRRHVTVTLSRPVRDNFERIMLQSLLGSDRFHEILSWKAAELGVENPTVFFESPDVATGGATK